MDMDKIVPQPLSAEELLERQFRQKSRELKIGRMRASVVRKQITEAYEILENIRFDYVSDTAFRDKIVSAKKGLESAISDFLLDDSYWKERIEKHQNLTPQQYDEAMKIYNTPQSSIN